MAKQRIKVRINWKSILYIALALLLCAGIGFGIYKIVDKTTTTEIRASAFSIGGLNANGKYKETKESIYTKDAFECQGLTITPKFESTVSYEVFFYDVDGEFLSNTGRMTTKYNEVPTFAKYARIVVTPLEDEEISLLEVNKYAKQLTVEVDKKQVFLYENNLFVANKATNGHTAPAVGTSILTLGEEMANIACSEVFEIKGYTKLVIFVENNTKNQYTNVVFADSIYAILSKNVKTITVDGSNALVRLEIDVPAGASYACVVHTIGETPYIYGIK